MAEKWVTLELGWQVDCKVLVHYIGEPTEGQLQEAAHQWLRRKLTFMATEVPHG